jgi:hypothetical protein
LKYAFAFAGQAVRRLPLVLSLALLAGGCRHPAPADGTRGDAAKRGAVVARVGRVELHEDDLERMMARDPGASAHRFDGNAARRELVEGMVRFELLAQAAERAGLMQDPDAVHAQQQIAVTKLVNQTLGAAASPAAISHEDIEREYALRRATDFTLPAAVHVRHIQIHDAARAAEIARKAKALDPNDDAAFATLASKSTEDLTTRSSGGDLGFIDRNSRLMPPLVQAASNLKTPGEVAGPVAVGADYEILRLVSLRAEAVSPLDAVEETIRQRLYRERRAAALDAFMTKLRAETPVEVVEPAPTTIAGVR